MAAPAMGALRLSAAGETDAGRRRRVNEDFVLVREDLGLFVVADGVGGERTGDVASKLASLSMGNFFEATRNGTWPDVFRAHSDLTLQDDAQRLAAAIRKANLDVFTIAQTRAENQRMNTTVVAAYVPPNQDSIHIGHVGDSRCYRIRHGRMDQLTRDHTLRNQARDEYPDIDEERISQIPASVLSRAIGQRNTVELAVRSLEPVAGDRFLLCSDGVTKMVSDDRIRDAVLAAESPGEGVHFLVELANEAGGRDNIAALLVWFDA